VSASLTAKKTANSAHGCGQGRTILESERPLPNCSKPQWIAVDCSPAVFKTVCGALLRRPGWVRFPSIPASLGLRYSQHDSHGSGHRRSLAASIGRQARASRLSPLRYRLHPTGHSGL
jgi:hypothetical protein